MTATAMPTMDVGDVLSFQEHVRTWADDSLTPEKTQELEQLIAKAVRIAAGLQNIWNVCVRDGSVWEAGFYAQRMRLMEFLGGIVVEILGRADGIATHTRAKHPAWKAPAAAAEVWSKLASAREIVAESRRLQEWLNRPAPPVNQEMIRQSRESLDRNEGESIDDVIARLENGGPLVRE